MDGASSDQVLAGEQITIWDRLIVDGASSGQLPLEKELRLKRLDSGQALLVALQAPPKTGFPKGEFGNAKKHRLRWFSLCVALRELFPSGESPPRRLPFVFP